MKESYRAAECCKLSVELVGNENKIMKNRVEFLFCIVVVLFAVENRKCKYLLKKKTIKGNMVLNTAKSSMSRCHSIRFQIVISAFS